MNNLKRLTIVFAFALVFGSAGVAGAGEVLMNGDAETGNLDNWTATAAVSALGGPTFEEHVLVDAFDNYLFSMGDGVAPDVVTGAHTASMHQNKSIAGCNAFINDVDLQGTWSFSSQYATQSQGSIGDWGTTKIAFFDGITPGPSTTNDNLKSPNAWALTTAGGNLPVGADNVTVTLTGTVLTGSGSQADVVYDNVSLSTDCVSETAKVSGKFASDGRSPTHVFGGALALLEGGDLAEGSIITVSYNTSEH